MKRGKKLTENNLKLEEGLWSKKFIGILMANLFVYISFYLLVPTLPAFAKQIGGSGLQASLVVSGFSIASLVCRAITGHITDKLDKKPIIMIGVLILGLCTISYSMLNITGIIILRIIQGIGWGMASTGIAAVVSEIVPNSRRGEGMGYYSLSMIISMSLAPIVAIMIMNAYKFNVVIVISIILLLVGVIFLKLVKVDNTNEKKSKFDNKKLIVISDLFEKRALLPSLLCFLLAITLCGIMSYIMLFGKEINMPNIWIYFIGHVAMILLTRSFVGKLFDKKGHAIVIIPGAISMIIGLLILSYVTNVTTLMIASLFYGFGYGAVQPSLQAWAINRSPLERRGAANGTFLSSMDLSFTIGSILLSFVAEVRSYAIMYRISTIFMVIFLIIYLLSLKKASDEKQIFEEEFEEVV